jgi:pSer/pThr/pTyr-binding forkhead associated (FHA) protein
MPMPPHGNNLGIMKPLGGGDPVHLRKPELIVGRRPSCDVVLDFENVSGKHCQLRYHNQVWYVRDLGSTNGTTVNGAPISSEHTVMPDDELGIANHIFSLDYEPGAPPTVLSQGQLLEEEVVETRKKTSLMELAGLDTDEDRPKRTRRPTKAPEVIERISAEEGEFEDELPQHVKAAPKPTVNTTDDDFLKFIEEDVKKPGEGKK